ncbi:hypothetical protein NL676_039538 [Syzygium grande]|nr:hypothetical protein NL676_039538 [Syzygium grande]
MAMRLVRFRRALAAPPALRRPLAAPFPSWPSSTPPPAAMSPPAIAPRPRSSAPPLLLFSRSLAYNAGGYNDGGGDKIDPDTVLFEGCDFNHWLITMDFPKDPKPTPEEMVRTYEETCARGLNISVEEAKKRMYACSTTTYQGFQAVMTEAESEQFKDLPGVVFILPDSYIDPQNKEYGGDKYENGVITHRPPPVQYGRPGVMDRIIRDMAKDKGSHHQGKRACRRTNGTCSKTKGACRKTNGTCSKTKGATDQKDKGELSKGDIRELKFGMQGLQRW